MTPRPQYRPLPILLLTATALLSAAASLPAATPAATDLARAAGTPELPLAFEPNVGQADPRVRFLARGPGFGAYLLRDGMALALKGANPSRVEDGEGRVGTRATTATSGPKGSNSPRIGGRGADPASSFARRTGSTSSFIAHRSSFAPSAFLRMRLVGTQAARPAAGQQVLPGQVSYFLGSDPQKWRTGVPTYARVEYPEVYPGVDLAYHSRGNELEYDFIVSPGASTEPIRLQFEGSDRMRLDDGDLVLDTPAGEVRHCAPVAYQEVNGVRKLVSCRYQLSDSGSRNADLGVRGSATSVAAEAPEPGRSSNLSNLRNLWLGSESSSPATSSSSSMRPQSEVSFALGTYDPQLPLVIDPVVRTPNQRKFHYSRFLGGSGDDFGNAIVVDAKLSPYVAGETFSTAFYPDASAPKTDSDAFVVKLSPDGETILHTTFFGGSENDSATGLALAPRTGHICVAGTTRSADFPVYREDQFYQGGDDGFHLVLHKNGREILRSTFLGGSGDDRVRDLAVDPAGRFHIAGETDSPDFPQRRPKQDYAGGLDGFLTITAANRSVPVFSSHFGGTGDDAIHGVAIGKGGVVYVCGQTASGDFPVKAAMQPQLRGSTDAFITKFSAGAAGLVFSTFLGDVGDEAALDIVEDFRRGTVVTGWTSSKKFPTHKPLQMALSGPRDAFLLRLNKPGKALIHSTFLGGTNEDQGNRVVLDPYDNIYLTGTAASPDIPRLSPGQGIFGGQEDAFAYQIAAHGERMLMGTYMGGDRVDQGRGIAVDRWGSLYITGATHSGGFPNSIPNTGQLGGFDAFVTKIGSGADTYVPPRL